jgi:hypothetical protein
MKRSTTPVAKAEWDFSTCFACLSPLIGILVGLPQLALVRWAKIRTQPEGYNNELKQSYGNKNK